jgi:SAM-dependent methyltransferase
LPEERKHRKLKTVRPNLSLQPEIKAASVVELLEKYITLNSPQQGAEADPFTIERYAQFHRFMPKHARSVLDLGASTGRGGRRLAELNPGYQLTALDCVQSRLGALPKCYGRAIYGLSTAISVDDQSFDAVVAGEFLEHLYPMDVDPTICELQRVLKVRGRLLMTTPNPAYLYLFLTGKTVYTVDHMTQHWPDLLKARLKMHGFSRVRVYGSGKMTRYIGSYFPFLFLYGSFLITGDKY